MQGAWWSSSRVSPEGSSSPAESMHTKQGLLSPSHSPLVLGFLLPPFFLFPPSKAAGGVSVVPSTVGMRHPKCTQPMWYPHPTSLSQDHSTKPQHPQPQLEP